MLQNTTMLLLAAFLSLLDFNEQEGRNDQNGGRSAVAWPTALQTAKDWSLEQTLPASYRQVTASRHRWHGWLQSDDSTRVCERI